MKKNILLLLVGFTLLASGFYIGKNKVVYENYNEDSIREHILNQTIAINYIENKLYILDNIKETYKKEDVLNTLISLDSIKILMPEMVTLFTNSNNEAFKNFKLVQLDLKVQTRYFINYIERLYFQIEKGNIQYNKLDEKNKKVINSYYQIYYSLLNNFSNLSKVNKKDYNDSNDMNKYIIRIQEDIDKLKHLNLNI